MQTSRYDHRSYSLLVMCLLFMIILSKSALGRVSFTSDVWSRQTMQSYMGVTAHFIAKSASNALTMETRLVAFRVLRGAHTGLNLAEEFLKVIKEIECLNKVRLLL